MKFIYTRTDDGATIRIDGVAPGRECAVVDDIRSCWETAAACPSGGCRNIGSIADRLESGSIVLNLTPRSGTQLDSSCIEECLRYRLRPLMPDEES